MPSDKCPVNLAFERAWPVSLILAPRRSILHFEVSMPSKPTEDRLLSAFREPGARMPGEFYVSTAFCLLVAWIVISEGWEFDGRIKYVLYMLVILPLAAPTAAFVVQYAVVLARRLAARLIVRRARAEFRSALRAARRHPELADIARLQAAAAALSRLAPADALRASAETAEAAQHPYAPIRTAGLTVIEAVGGARREARSGPSSSL
jgi:hypothetical protein